MGIRNGLCKKGALPLIAFRLKSIQQVLVTWSSSLIWSKGESSSFGKPVSGAKFLPNQIPSLTSPTITHIVFSNWENMTHVFMEVDAKEQAKAEWGFSAVPFYVVVDANGSVIGTGEPKTVDYSSLIADSAANKATKENDIVNAAAPTFTVDEDF